MTNAQKWILIILAVFAVLSVITWVTYDEEPPMQTNNMQVTSEDKPALDDALVLANRIGCTKCHGIDLKGTLTAPTLVEAKNYWNRTSLINYLRNPSSFGNEQRIMDYKRAYSSFMPGYDNVDVKDLGKIADYILKLEE